jgi:ribosomal protein S18 acetylase RimI-like enzyme
MVSPLAALPALEIVPAGSAAQVQSARALFREYQAYLGVDLCFQSFEQELAALPGEYAPPGGRLLLALWGGEVAGCIALRDLGQGVCEMKRLFVRPAFHGKGIGWALARRIVEEARQAGYRHMRLDTLPQMQKAQALYETLGFHDIPAYRPNPNAGTRYMELVL